jgi:hypothetical protein
MSESEIRGCLGAFAIPVSLATRSPAPHTLPPAGGSPGTPSRGTAPRRDLHDLVKRPPTLVLWGPHDGYRPLRGGKASQTTSDSGFSTMRLKVCIVSADSTPFSTR